MEIFSFYEPQNDFSRHVQLQNTVRKQNPRPRASSFTPVYSSPVFVRDLLHQQQPDKVKTRARGTAKAVNSLYLTISRIEDALQAHFFTCLLYVCVSIAGALILYAGFSAADYIDFTTLDPLVLDSYADTDTNLVDTAMKNFILSRTAGVSVDEGGNIISDSIAAAVSYTQPVTYTTYTVKPNDNLTSITKKNGLTNISTLIAINNITNVRRLQAGQRLTVPSIDGLLYSVAAKDSLDTISAKYEISIEKLVDVNDLSSSVLYAGQKLFIPGAKLDSNELKKALGELFVSPLNVSWRMSSNYGYRADPFTGVRSFHTGIDMVAPLKTPVRAASDGKVVVASYSAVYGNYVILSHADGYQTLYAHLYSATVQVGERITQGTKIGLLGNTGYSTGAHLHFTVYKNGKLINPYEVLK